MNWRIPAVIVVFVALGWLAIWDALHHPVEPDELDLEARRAKVIYRVNE